MPPLRPRFRPSCEGMEPREVPAAVPFSESFDAVTAPATPTGWQTWTNDSQNPVSTAAGGLSGPNALSLPGSATSASRFWNKDAAAGNTVVTANVRFGSAPVGIFARGYGLDNVTARYLAAVVDPSGRVDLVDASRYSNLTLGSLSLGSVPSGTWLRLTLVPTGASVRVDVYRLDTMRSVGSIHGTTTLLPDFGRVGVVRMAGSAGAGLVDDFQATATAPPFVERPTTTPTTVSESFDGTATGAIPAGWSSWKNDGQAGFSVTSPKYLAAVGNSASASRAWPTQTAGSDATASVSLFADSLIPATVFVRGANLDSTTPSYVGATVVRGTTLSLVNVSNGISTTLGSVTSRSYVSQKWLRIELSASGQTLTASVQRLDTNQWLQPDGNWSATKVAAIATTSARPAAGGLVGLGRTALYAGTLTFDNFEYTVAASPPPPASEEPTVPYLPRNYDHIRIAALAYSGNPMGAFEQTKLATSVDLVIPNPVFQATVDAAAPETPQLVYTNVSNLYLGVLTDWLNYADEHGVDRELAFYHVPTATAFNGSSPSSQAVNWFWGVYRTGNGNVAPTDLTRNATGGRSGGTAFGGEGQSLAVGYVEPFREINVALSAAAKPGWQSVIEYPSAVDANGNVTAWKTLALRSDGTNGFTAGGRIAFDPPADWVAGKLPGTADRLYYVRVRTTAGTSTQAPTATTILGRDYVGANGTISGTIPAFDSHADANRDGYLNDAEYSTRATGFDARFEYETRLFYPQYGQMRFVTNPSSTAVQEWAAEYMQEILAANPLADGLFLDNSNGKLPFPGIAVSESTATYVADSAALVGTVWKAVAPKLVFTNTVGSRAEANPIAANSTGAVEEFLLRPMGTTWASVGDAADLVAQRLAASDDGYLVLDTHPAGGSPSDPRTKLGALAYYYLLADPDRTMIMFFGGSNPAMAWSTTWIAAAEVDVGTPTAAMTTWATGQDPQNPALTYKVFGRTYSDSLVLYKPLSYTLRVGSGTTADATATTHDLGGRYRAVNADGSLGPVITSITLRNGEGAVLLKA